MQFRIGYHLIIKLSFSDDEFEFLTKAITKLKDAKQAIGPGQFWQLNISRRLKNSEDESACTVTIRQVESFLLKALQPYILYGNKDIEERQIARDIYYQLEKIIIEVLDESEMLNDPNQTFEAREYN
jgi:hypothetical protein